MSVAAILARGRLGIALLLVAAATAVSAANAQRIATEVSIQEMMFGERRSPLVDLLIAQLGRDLTSVVLHLVESSWGALLVAAALGPFLIWILGATAVHAAARLIGRPGPFTPILILTGYATAVTRIPADLAAVLLSRQLPQIAGIVSTLATLWFAYLVWSAIRIHYGTAGGQALVILAVALVFFYLVPSLLVIVAIVAILVAAVLLDFFPGPR